jgi:hypothetical protein
MKIIFVQICISILGGFAIAGCSSNPIKIPYEFKGPPNLTITMNVGWEFLTSHETYVEIFKETRACDQYDTLGMFKLSGNEQTIAIPTIQALLVRVTYIESGRWQNAKREDQVLFKPVAGESYHLVYTNQSGLSGLELFLGKKLIEGKSQDCLFQPRKKK